MIIFFFRKQKAAYTAASGVLHYLYMNLYRLLKTNDCATNNPFAGNNVVDVYPVVFSNDSAALETFNST